uniref:G-protein coupled receptors family 3 profile domain-containing protein n=1 Tax=Maylandia zebra TaxID=106582 RepID=A0A3P9B1L3_9CICH
MVFAIEEINNSTELLPGIRLGYQIYDSCASVPVAVHMAFQFLNSFDPVFSMDNNCSHSGMVMAVVGGSGSTTSISLSQVIRSFNIPQVSHFSTCSCLSDKQQYPNFFRTFPSDQFQAEAMAKLVKHFGWTWIGAVRSDSDFGNNGMASFLKAAQKEGICVEYSLSFHRTYPHSRIQRVIYCLQNYIFTLSYESSPSRQWIGSFWVTNPELMRFSFCKVCDGNEDIQNLQNQYTDTSQLRVTNMAYMAVYAVAHAIHNAVCQEIDGTVECDKLTKLESKQILIELKKVNFSQNGYDVSFDANGDPVAIYELVNWQKSENGVTEIVAVGLYDTVRAGAQTGNLLITRRTVPVSVCTDSCPPGTRKVLQKGKPICCYDCTACPEGEINSTDCLPCQKEFWPNKKRDTCIPKPVEYLSFQDLLGIILATFSVIGACLTIVTAAVFFCHRKTPIVRANNSELSFLLLISLTLCFLCSLTFIGAPSEWSCMLRHTAFGITFVLCISCVLGKTIVVLMAFKATIPGSNVMKWFGPPQQRMTVVSFTFIQVLICTVWLVVNPPFPIKNLTTYKEKIILECALGSAAGFWAVLGYLGILAAFCFVLAVLARKLPDNFNEAKLITISMLIFCTVWITFIPAYVSSPGKFTVVVEIFAILASSFGLIMCIFAPKCFIILFKPEKNTKKYLINKNQL